MWTTVNAAIPRDTFKIYLDHYSGWERFRVVVASLESERKRYDISFDIDGGRREYAVVRIIKGDPQ